jgi:hypothetical protein
LIQVVEELGEKVNSEYSELIVVEFPDKFLGCYSIYEYDGKEEALVDYRKLGLKLLQSLTPDNVEEWKKNFESLFVSQ